MDLFVFDNMKNQYLKTINNLFGDASKKMSCLGPNITVVDTPGLNVAGPREIDENDQTLRERVKSPILAWINPLFFPTTSAHVQHQSTNIDEDVQEQVGWQDPALWLQSQCFPAPAVPNFVEKIKKYLKANIYSLVLISFLLPPNMFIIIIKFCELKCEDWGPFKDNFFIFNMIFVFVYPYFVKLKLDNFH